MAEDSPTTTAHSEDPAIDFLAYAPEARKVLDLLLLQEPDLNVKGLFRAGKGFFIVSDSAMTQRKDGKTFQQWFQHDFRPAGLLISLVETCPPDAESVSPLTAHEVLAGYGEFRTLADLIRDVALALPSSFPLATVRVLGRVASVVVERALTAAESRSLDTAFAGLGTCLRLSVEVQAPSSPVLPKAAERTIDLLPSHYLPRNTPTVVRRAVETDDDLWRSMDSMQSLSAIASVADLLNPWPEIQDVACLIGTVFPPANIRCYLSLYKNVVIQAPTSDHLEKTLAGLCISKEELKTLVVSGAVRILAPYSVERYDLSWLADLLESAPHSVMMSRRLALISLGDQHRRNPLFALPSTTLERRAVLQLIRHATEHLPGDSSAILRALNNALSNHWAFAECTLRARGAMASLSGGLARFGSAVASELFGRDFIIEIGSAALDVEWAGALGAHLIPQEGLGYTSAGPAGLLIALSSGGIRGAPLMAQPAEFDLAEELLAFDNDTSVTELSAELGRGDLGRFRTLVRDIVVSSTSAEDLKERVRTWNLEVRRYERRPDRVRSFNLFGVLAAATASMVSGSETLKSIVPVVALALPYLLTKTNEDLIQRTPLLGTIMDWANGNAAGTPTRAVLLSRMRKRVRGMGDL